MDPGASRLSLFLAPAAFAGLLILMVGGLLIAGWIGRPATGERLTIVVRSDCASDWASVIEGRSTSIGLGEPAIERDGDAVRLTATMPGQADDRESIPALLTRRGAFAIHAAGSLEGPPLGEPLATQADLTEVHLDLDLRNHPLVELTFQPHALERIREVKEGALVYTLDGEIVGGVDAPMNGAKFEIQPVLMTLKEELKVATDWNIILRNGYAPCPAGEISLEAAG